MPESGTRRIRSEICMTYILEIGTKIMELIYSAGFWSICHGPNVISHLQSYVIKPIIIVIQTLCFKRYKFGTMQGHCCFNEKAVLLHR